MSRRSKFCFGTVASLTLVVGFVIGSMRLPQIVSQLSYAAEAGRAQAAHEQLKEVSNLSEAFKAVAKALQPSVVTVTSVVQMQAEQNEGQRPEIPEHLRQFFGDDFERFFDTPQQPRDFEQRGLGSGAIISEQGHIVTNNHVVRNATSVKVTLSDGRELEAKVVGTDPKTDLAVLKVEAENLVAVQFGDSDAMEVGDWVLAIGNPFELQHTVTAGIISAKGRVTGILGREGYEDFLQTDAAINPGNSGGPLVNMKGEVIGINSAIASRNGFYMGVGFAIPSNMVRSITSSIIESGHVRRAQLGALIQNLDAELAKSFGYDSTRGVLIGDVVSGSPAEKAGLKSGDIVTQLNGRVVDNRDQLRRAIASTAPGTEVGLTVFRDGKTREVKVQLAELSDKQAAQVAANGNDSDEAEGTADALGLAVESLTAEKAEELGYKEEVTGALVTKVAPDSTAARLGLSAGDVIMAVGDDPINSADDYRKAVKDVDVAKGIRLQVMRDGVRQFLLFKESK